MARKVLSDTQGRVKAGVLPAMEILNAEFGVATREKELIDAEKALADQVDTVSFLLQINGSVDLTPVDVPSKDSYQADEASEVELALLSRPELKDLKISLKSAELQARVADNRVKPDLSFSANAAFTGLAKDNNRNLERVASGDYPVWSLGFTFDYPLGNSAAENEAVKSRLKVEQIRTQLRSLSDSVTNEVRSALRGVAANYKQLEVADRGRAFAEERLKSFSKRSEVGLATIKDVLDVENDLVTAKNNQIRALVDYNNAITKLWQNTGQLLDKQSIRIDEKQGDALYKEASR